MRYRMTMTWGLTGLLLGGPGWAASEIQTVVVFADRAEVTRARIVPCKNGRAEGRFSELSVQLDVRTLRGRGSSRARVLGTSHRTVTLDGDPKGRQGELQVEHQAVLDRITGLQAELAVLEDRVKNAGAFAGYLSPLMAEGFRDPKASPAAWTQALEFIEKDQIEARTQAVDLKARARVEERKAEHLKARLQAAGGAAPIQAIEAVVAVECKGVNQVRIALSYVIPGATWRPEYDLRFQPPKKSKVGKGTVQLTVSAVVQQSTGEDWDEVQLMLSTAKPKLGIEAPYPATLWVNGYEEETGKVMVQGQERREELKASSGKSGRGPASAELEDGGQSFVLELPHKVTVKADGRPYWMPVDEITARGTARLAAVPKVSPYVYQALKFENPAAYPLLKGTLHTFRGSAYVGDAPLAYAAPGEPMEVSLGIDENLRVERTIQTEKDRKPGIFGGNQRFERHYRIRVHNRTRRRQTIEVRENIPVSKDEAIEVEMNQEKTSKGAKVDALRGFVAWPLKVRAGKSSAVDLAYTIAFPKDWQVR